MPRTPKDIFLDALDLPTQDRIAFVERECAGDAELRGVVLELLAAHDAAPTFDPPAVGSSVVPSTGGSRHATAPETVGDRINERYELLKNLGEGGFGIVFLARQHEPIERDVALKLLKVDSGHIVTRFEAERQTLARMDHPNIARVFDAGTSERGKPYFVMEYVAGEPITTYCEKHQLELNEKLALFESVCLAVQHAHQRGVIHRDLKPGNILVATVDGKPVPKVIDFGIAKAVANDDEEIKPTLTLEAQIIGTPQYMAPEQATIGPRNIDTRCDVYSLGTVLYELITGAPPFDPKELRKLGLDELCRVVRERSPSKPSTRLSTIGDAPKQDTTRLRRQVAGEVDWIVMRAMEKEPARRYQSAGALAADVRRYLNHQPIEAGPPSRVYQFRKFARRHRLEVAAATLVLASLVTVAVVSTVKERSARQARDAAQSARDAALAAEASAKRELAKANAIAEFSQDLLGGIGPSVARGRDTALLKDLLNQAIRNADGKLTSYPELDLVVRGMISQAQSDLGEYRQSIDTLRPLVDHLRDTSSRDNADRLLACVHLGAIYNQIGDLDNARAMFAEANAGYERLGDTTAYAALQARVGLGDVATRERRFDDALSIYRDVLKQLEATQRAESPLALLVRNSIGLRLQDLKRPAEALATWESLLEVERRVLGAKDQGTLACMLNLATAYADQDDHERASAYTKQVLDVARTIYEPGHPALIPMLINLSSQYITLERFADAQTMLVEAGQLIDAKPETAKRYRSKWVAEQLSLLRAEHRYEDALPIARELCELRDAELGPGSAEAVAARATLAGVMLDGGHPEDALDLLKSLGDEPYPGDADPAYRSNYQAIWAQTFLALNQPEAARARAVRARELAAGSPVILKRGVRLAAVEKALGLTPTTQP